MILLRRQSAFTLIELLIVIAIVGILSLVVILVINPIELLRQARDTTRLSDLDTLNHALNLYQGDVTVGPSFGTASTTYISVADPSATSTAGSNCAGLNLPSLSSGWNYHCAASSTLRNVDGTGWVPVNFTSISFGAPLGTLPVDPVNTTSSSNYYTYTPGGSWELSAIPESKKYRAFYASTPIPQPGVILTGSNLSLSPIFNTSGLVGYWSFDDGTGTAAVDKSGTGNNGGLVGSSTWIGGTSCKVAGCLALNGTNQYVSVNNSGSLAITGSITLSAWMQSGLPSTIQSILSRWGLSNSYALLVNYTGNKETFYPTVTGAPLNTSAVSVTDGNWHLLTGTYDGSLLKVYVDGLQVASTTGSGSINDNAQSLRIGYDGSGFGSAYFSGSLDDVRVYNRALSAAEITALYNATK